MMLSALLPEHVLRKLRSGGVQALEVSASTHAAAREARMGQLGESSQVSGDGSAHVTHNITRRVTGPGWLACWLAAWLAG